MGVEHAEVGAKLHIIYNNNLKTLTYDEKKLKCIARAAVADAAGTLRMAAATDGGG